MRSLIFALLACTFFNSIAAEDGEEQPPPPCHECSGTTNLPDKSQKNIKILMYYDASAYTCKEEREFFKDRLCPLLEYLEEPQPDSLKFAAKPGATAKIGSDGKVTCGDGGSCENDLWHYCASDDPKFFKFMCCTMTKETLQGEQCAKEAGLQDWNKVVSCANSEGTPEKLSANQQEASTKLSEETKFPAFVINDVFDECMNEKFFHDPKSICELFQPGSAPQEICASSSQSTTTSNPAETNSTPPEKTTEEPESPSPPEKTTEEQDSTSPPEKTTEGQDTPSPPKEQDPPSPPEEKNPPPP